MFRYDKVYGGAFWYTNVFKEYGVICYMFVKTGYGSIVRINTETMSDSLTKRLRKACFLIILYVKNLIWGHAHYIMV